MQTKQIGYSSKILAIVFAIATTSYSFSQNSKVKFGKGLYVMAKDSSMDCKFNLRFQTLFLGEQTMDVKSEFKDDFQSEFLIRRARLKFAGFVYNPKITYKVELGLSNKDIGWKKVDGSEANYNAASNIMLDAVVKWKFAKNTTLWVGQTKLPGNRERVISSQQLQLVDRSLLNNQFNLDRDIGIQLHHHFKIGSKFTIREALAISQGEGRNVTSGNDDGFCYTGRVEVLPFGDFKDHGDYVGADISREETPKLSIAATYDYNDDARRKNGQLGSFITVDSLIRDIQSIHADLMFKVKGFSVMGEYATRFVADKDPSSYYVGEAYNIQAGYLFKNNFEIAGRYTQLRPSKYNAAKKSYYSGDKTSQFTLGLSKYIVGHSLKVQGDISSTLLDNDLNNYLMYRLQVEFQF